MRQDEGERERQEAARVARGGVAEEDGKEERAGESDVLA